MTIPTFKPSDYFIDEEIRLRCLRGKAQNSSVPKLAEIYISETKEDPEFEIFLRGEKAEEVSPWQKEMLERLFEDGELVKAVETSFKQYKECSDPDDLELEREFWVDAEQNGFLRHVELSTVVVDDIKRQVLLSLSTDSEGNLDEHGICIVMKGGEWSFHQGDYLSDYSSEIQSQVAADRWKQLYPASATEASVETDASFLYGTWEFDEDATVVLLKRIGVPAATVKGRMENYAAYCVELTENEFKFRTSPWNLLTGKLLGVKRQGNSVSITSDIFGRAGAMEFVYEGQRLKHSEGFVLKHTKISDANAAAALKSDNSFIFGQWVFDPKQTELLLRHRGVSDIRVKVELAKYGMFKLDVSRTEVSISVGGAKLFKFPVGGCEKSGDKVTLNMGAGREEYFHQGNLLASITSSMLLVYRKEGTVDSGDLDCDKVCKMFSHVKMRPGL